MSRTERADDGDLGFTVLRPIALLILAILMPAWFAFCDPAVADERVVGPGYAFDLPDAFEETQGPWAVVARATGETLVQGLPVRPIGPPEMQFFAVPGPAAAPEAILLVCRFELRAEDALGTVDDLPPGSVATAYKNAVELLPGGRLDRTGAKVLEGGLRVVLSRFDYPHPSAGKRAVESAVAIQDSTGVILLLDAPAGRTVEYRAYFTAVVDSLKLMRPAPSLMEQLRYPIYGLLGLLAVLLIVSIRLRHRHSRKAARLAAQATPRPRMRVIACDLNPNLPLGAEPDGAPTAPMVFDPTVEEPLVEAAAGAGATPGARAGKVTLRTTRPGLRPTRHGEAPPPPPPADDAAPSEAEPAPDEAPPSKLKISRNADFLQG